MAQAIITSGLTKVYGKKVGCRNIDLSVSKGLIFGLLGPNGAGKSTLVKMLIGLVHPTSGEASLLDRPIGDVRTRQRVGFLPENFKYQEWLTGRELLAYHTRLSGIDKGVRDKRIDESLGLVKLAAAANSKIRTYSKGMQQRIGLACALLAEPELLFFDEPTSALDPVGRVEVREIISHLKERGTTVFLNSHLLGEIEMVCDEVAIMKDGEIVTRGRMDELLRGKVEVRLRTGPLDETTKRSLLDRATLIESKDALMRLEFEDERSIAAAAKIVVDSGAPLYELSPRRRSLEELFLEIVKEDE